MFAKQKISFVKNGQVLELNTIDLMVAELWNVPYQEEFYAMPIPYSSINPTREEVEKAMSKYLNDSWQGFIVSTLKMLSKSDYTPSLKEMLKTLTSTFNKDVFKEDGNLVDFYYGFDLTNYEHRKMSVVLQLTEDIGKENMDLLNQTLGVVMHAPYIKMLFMLINEGIEMQVETIQIDPLEALLNILGGCDEE